MIKAAKALDLPGDVEKWRAMRAEIKADVLEKSYAAREVRWQARRYPFYPLHELLGEESQDVEGPEEIEDPKQDGDACEIRSASGED